ncbi:acetylcholine receptor subunit beta-type lev-1-like [Ostrea edulis]|uniref:acetylcholine receptor subunit beta-type lev-1-like n=1 Tax=Ostrea edulis TaxID=37623 RepID=UPI0020944ED2|nr:acetylcholine receptor subunit beta-type lev-1-like [Ostrea edulis]
MGLLMAAGLAGGTHLSYTIEEYTELQNSLLGNYSSKIRPIKNQGQSLQMEASLWISSINDVSAVDQKMITTAYLNIEWTDELLTWDSTSTGIYWMQINQKDIWMPDIVLKNGFSAFKALGGDFYYNFVDYDGTIHWYPYTVFESICDIDVSFYPFDTQTCDIIFTSWSYTRWEINLTVPTASNIGFYEFVPNSVWEVVSTDASHDLTSSDNDIKFTINLKRKPLYYIMTLVLPIVFLGILNLLVFIIPADAGEKMGFAVTIFLTFAVFLTIVSGELPINSDSVSILSIYLIIKLAMGIFVLLVTSIQLRLHHRGAEHTIGKVFRFIVRVERGVECDGRPKCWNAGCLSGKCGTNTRITQVQVEEKYARDDVKTEEEKNDKEEEEMTWSDVSSAIDFVSFWTLLLFEFVVTTVVFTYASVN